MQAQSVQTHISSSQSLASVQTLLKAGLGCITFLRNLLPTDNFNQSHFTSASSESWSQSSIDTTNHSVDGKRKNNNINAFKIMTITRGFTEEADKLLNYMEYGIFDALQKQYLRSFILAIHLDNKDPNNIVEAYTFNFNYHTIEGSGEVIPVMSLSETVKNMSLGDNAKRRDAVSEAVRKGKAPTILDVKKSVKALLKQLIQVTTQMDPLPKRRYATFKLFYTDSTPSEYEPPNFQAGDAEKDRWFFTTHNKDEIPEKWSVGTLETGHHGVNVNVTSVSAYLPSATEDNNALFTGTTSRQTAAPSLTPVQEATLRARQAELQIQDAYQRNVAWPVEEGDIDAEGDEDPDFTGSSGLLTKSFDLRADAMEPLGLRDEAGVIQPFLDASEGGQMYLDDHTEEPQWGGVSESVPSGVGAMNSKTFADKRLLQHVGSTQVVDPTVPLAEASSSTCVNAISSHGEAPLPPSDWSPSVNSQDSNSGPPHGMDVDSIDTQALADLIGTETPTINDSEMLDMETQAAPLGRVDPIESFDNTDSHPPTREGSNVLRIESVHVVVDHGLNCDCGIQTEEDHCFCEGGCGRWYHLWCMGYHSITDPRVPSKFICFDCRVQADPHWELIKVELYSTMMSKFKDLALFRKAIKVAECGQVETPTGFTRLMCCTRTLGRQLFNRLEDEGFIAIREATLDESGLLSTDGPILHTKNKSKFRKTMQKTKYMFDPASKKGPKYLDYFNPSHEVESRLLELSNIINFKKGNRQSSRNDYNEQPDGLATPKPLPPTSLHLESQTQQETQLIADSVVGDNPKRKLNYLGQGTVTTRPSKRTKTSVTLAVDLAE